MDQSLAVVGCGCWGKNLVRNFAQLGVLGFICDSDDAFLQAYREEYPNIRRTSRLEEVLTEDSIQLEGFDRKKIFCGALHLTISQ